jgi:phosphoribulokinase
MITIIDHIGRMVIGQQVNETKTTVTVSNPVIIHVQPNPQTGQLQVQSFPYVFVEFIDKDHRDKNEWSFDKSAIATSNVVLDSKIVEQYNNMISPPAAPAAEPEVIKLFSEE